MPYNLQFSLCISVFHMETAYLGILWISPEVVGSVVWSQACECVTWMNRLVICINVEQQRGKDAALWKAILLLLSAPSAAFADKVHTKCLLDNMFWISSVSSVIGV